MPLKKKERPDEQQPLFLWRLIVLCRQRKRMKTKQRLTSLALYQVSNHKATMHFSREQITMLKRTPIVCYLRSLGVEPVKQSGVQLVYRSPLTGEQTPSFYVHPQKNVFNCFSSEEKGDVIRLVTLLERTDFKTALDRLASFDANQRTAVVVPVQPLPVAPPAPPVVGPKLLDERALFNRVLMDYVISRNIPPQLAKMYLHEVRYEFNNREYYAVGFKTDKDSYALRSKAFKGWLGASAIRTIAVAGSTSVDVFEGFFDFLSALAHNRMFRPVRTTVILNSANNLKQALPVFEGARKINCYFDNDAAGRKAFAKLKSLELPVKDCSTLYAGYNDLNDKICHQFGMTYCELPYRL